jgi:hypothetical protein
VQTPAALPALPAPTEASRCSTCGYTLVGLEPDGLCPECGASIADSLRGGFLAYAPLPRVRQLSQWAVLTGLAVLFADGLGFFFSIAGNFSWLVSLPINLFLTFTVWKLTRPEPGIQPKFDAPTTRRRLRVSAAGVPVMLTCALIFEWTGLRGMVGGTAARVLAFLWIAVYWLLRILLHVELAMYARWLAGRVPAASLKTFASICAAAGGVLAGVDFLGACCFVTPIAGLLYLILFLLLASELRGVISLRTAAALLPPAPPTRPDA